MTCWYGCRSPNWVERKQDCIGDFDRDFGTGVVADVAQDAQCAWVAEGDASDYRVMDTRQAIPNMQCQA